MTDTRQLPDQMVRMLGRIKVSDAGCWEWQGALTTRGYGQVTRRAIDPPGPKSVSAHRLAYTLCVSPVPDGLFVLHRCDNRRCCNPEHLFLGTQRDNIRDMHAKGRGGKASVRLSDAEVLSARRLRQQGQTYVAIAKRFGVEKTTVRRAITGETWKHLPPSPAGEIQP